MKPARAGRSQVLLLAAGLAASTLACADAQDAFNIVAGVTINHEDNLFRLPSGTNPAPAGSHRSDNVYGANVGIRFDKEYSLQRLQFEATATKYRFDNNTFLNFSGVNYRGAWLWAFTPRIKGELSASRSETLVPYSDQRTLTLNRSTQINENRQFTIDGEVAAAWHLVGGLGQTRSRNSQPFTQVGDYEQDGVEAGVKYLSAAGNSVTVVQRESRGDYSRTAVVATLLDSGFDQSETEARVLWRVSGHTSLDGRLGYLKREHNNFSQRNYSGTVGKLDYLWTPTGKLQFNVSASRNLYSYQDTQAGLYSSSYYVADTFAIAPAWLLSDKTTLRMKLEHVERDFRGPVAAAPQLRGDRTQSLQFGADWKATRTIFVQGNLQRERRSSNIAGYDYTANVIGISGRLMF